MTNDEASALAARLTAIGADDRIERLAEEAADEAIARLTARHAPTGATFAAFRADGPAPDEVDDAVQTLTAIHAGDDDDDDLTFEERDVVAPYAARGYEALAAARAAIDDHRHIRKYACGSGRRPPPMSQFVAAHPRVLAATGKALFIGG